MIKFEATPRCPDSSAKENRFIPVTDYYQKPIPMKSHEKSQPLIQKRSRQYERDGMIKEVNDIIGELQCMLKPKVSDT